MQQVALKQSVKTQNYGYSRQIWYVYLTFFS